MEKKLLSIIIPCYNAEGYIDRCVRSLVKQTIGIENLELIFVNDASTDGTLGRLRRWEKRFPNNIMIIDCQENHRQGGARNIGMLNASADYIGFVDSDDWVEPDMYQEMYDKAVTYQCDVVSVHFQREESNGYVYEELTMPEGKADIPVCRGEDGNWPEGVQKPYGGVWSKIYRKKIILDNEVFFPEKLAYEDNFWGAVLGYYYNSFYVIPKAMYHYIVNWNSTILKKNSEAHKDRLKIEIMKLEELEKRGLAEGREDEIEFNFIKLYYLNSLHTFFSRFPKQPYELLREMQQEVLRRFPNFESNSKIHTLNEVQKMYLETIRMPITDEEWELLASGHRKALNITLTDD